MRKREGRWLIRRRAVRRPALSACPQVGGIQARRTRPSRRGLFGPGDDRGASAIELVILAPALIFVSMLVIQFALWLDASHAALSAAQEGDRAARAAKSSQTNWQQTATQVAMSYYHGLDTSVLGNVSVSKITADDAANTVSLTVSGQLNGIFPLTISETVTGPVECFRTSASGGTNCG
ncbi:MAG TPA: TadE/TadG family type IV pilus assembly protein [Trebonia sp.]